MNLENFADYLKYPSRLYQLPYEELKSLTLQYPYCGNFHILLLIKSKLESHPDLERNLAKAATYSVDRRFLRQFMQDNVLLRPESRFTIGEDEILELKDLFTLDSELEKIPLNLSDGAEGEEFPAAASLNSHQDNPPAEELLFPGGSAMEDSLAEADLTFSNPAGSFSETELPESEVPVIVPEDSEDNAGSGIPDAAAEYGVFAPEPALIADLAAVIGITERRQPQEAEPKEVTAPLPTSFKLPQSIVRTAAAAGRATDHWWALQEQHETHTVEWEIPLTVSLHHEPENVHPPAGQKIRFAPTPKSRFKSYRKGYRPPPIGMKPPLPAGQTPDPVVPEPAREVAQDSVREDLEIASETLAGILVRQHQYDRAIKMYEHLSLLIPEKNTYFAAKIDAIKNL